MERKQLSDKALLHVLEVLTINVGKRLEKHGRGAFLSQHEALGVLTEEFWEVTDAVRGTDLAVIAEEYFDVAVTCVVAVASMVAGGESKEEVSEKETVDPDYDITKTSEAGIYIANDHDVQKYSH